MVKDFGRDFSIAMIAEIGFVFFWILDIFSGMVISAIVFSAFIVSMVINVIIECEKEEKPNHKFNWTNYCATCTNRNQCSEESCTMYSICLIKDPSQFTRNSSKAVEE